MPRSIEMERTFGGRKYQYTQGMKELLDCQ